MAAAPMSLSFRFAHFSLSSLCKEHCLRANFSHITFKESGFSTGGEQSKVFPVEIVKIYSKFIQKCSFRIKVKVKIK